MPKSQTARRRWLVAPLATPAPWAGTVASFWPHNTAKDWQTTQGNERYPRGPDDMCPGRKGGVTHSTDTIAARRAGARRTYFRLRLAALDFSWSLGGGLRG